MTSPSDQDNKNLPPVDPGRPTEPRISPERPLSPHAPSLVALGALDHSVSIDDNDGYVRKVEEACEKPSPPSPPVTVGNPGVMQPGPSPPRSPVDAMPVPEQAMVVRAEPSSIEDPSSQSPSHVHHQHHHHHHHHHAMPAAPLEPPPCIHPVAAGMCFESFKDLEAYMNLYAGACGFLLNRRTSRFSKDAVPEHLAANSGLSLVQRGQFRCNYKTSEDKSDHLKRTSCTFAVCFTYDRKARKYVIKEDSFQLGHSHPLKGQTGPVYPVGTPTAPPVLLLTPVQQLSMGLSPGLDMSTPGSGLHPSLQQHHAGVGHSNLADVLQTVAYPATERERYTTLQNTATQLIAQAVSCERWYRLTLATLSNLLRFPKLEFVGMGDLDAGATITPVGAGRPGVIPQGPPGMAEEGVPTPNGIDLNAVHHAHDMGQGGGHSPSGHDGEGVVGDLGMGDGRMGSGKRKDMDAGTPPAQDGSLGVEVKVPGDGSGLEAPMLMGEDRGATGPCKKECLDHGVEHGVHEGVVPHAMPHVVQHEVPHVVQHEVPHGVPHGVAQ
eukprot:jgi/Mesvir1/26482/Mv16151-RA.1